jgi:hypothetical protein
VSSPEFGNADEVLGRQFRLHLHRAISYLATPQAIRSVGDLIRLALEGGREAIHEGDQGPQKTE